ncbi:glucose-1-phosphate adenylyltransferase [Deinococcus wulumuqiensis]|uniref:Glucose-1-phosphate adenylyltransferase n=1 Tax=Deinococcus wulumuqiensis TaxID=980427 RepID=A0AAV4K278_9DEIO|nr:glucose-1-phosphate adenylyltransferase [Deinococcus wulumuqiensis]QII20506.1 glucose-1-phosphate adenylyltransferase [Deinococcus wulumuqiensis R12]GGI78159.1 glucose-1-phosphate adenylyltransferase [Deinococcus wulumuqiensis]GGP28922.1 glucose-1-phosphate adenylyltransferase [Deinococcus wulumuqiensis]
MKPRILGMILAGGQGSRLAPLTQKRSKPAVPFGSKYRIIDFAINNFINSGMFSVYVLTQYKAQSLTEHIQRGWRFGTFLSDYFITLVPAQMYRFEELGNAWYRGTADAVYQNMHLIENYEADYVAIFSGDHIYKMNVEHMLGKHIEARADITIAAYPMPRAQAHQFGVMQVDERWRVTEFHEKVPDPPAIPGDPDTSLTSMGNYIFSRRALEELLEASISGQETGYDFGHNVIPRALSDGYHVQAYDFHKNPIPGQDRPNTYWRDVGTLDAYFEANMDLVSVNPEFDIYNPEWPLRTSSEFSPPAKFVHESEGRKGQAFNSIMAGGTIISGGTVRDSVLGRGVRTHSYSLVESCVLFDEVQVGRHSHLHRVIVDKDVVIPPGTTIGLNPDQDAERGFTVTESGVVVVPKGYVF